MCSRIIECPAQKLLFKLFCIAKTFTAVARMGFYLCNAFLQCWRRVTTENREGWSLLTVETEVNGVSKSTYKSCPFLVGFLGLSRQESIVIIKCGIDDDCVKGRCSTLNFISKVWKLSKNFESKIFFLIGCTMVPSFHTLYPIWFIKVP